jgi:hypothetical protein
MLSGVFSKFPNSILKPHRKKQSYISAMLSKNEKIGMIYITESYF